MGHNVYLSLSDVKGDVDVDPYSGWITVEGYTWAGSNSSGNSLSGFDRSRGGRVSLKELHLTIKTGRSSRVLLERVASGINYPIVRLVVVKLEGRTVVLLFEFEMTNASVASFSTSSGMDQASFIFDKMTYQYREGPTASPAKTPPRP